MFDARHQLSIFRWVKRALALKTPPIMQKPGGQVTQHYGLDSKSRYVRRATM